MRIPKNARINSSYSRNIDIMQSRDDLSSSPPASNHQDHRGTRAEANSSQESTTTTNTPPSLTRIRESWRCDCCYSDCCVRCCEYCCRCCLRICDYFLFAIHWCIWVFYAVIDFCTCRGFCPGQYWLSRVKRHGLKFQDSPEEFFEKDRRFVMAAVQQDGEALGWASPEFQNDKGIVMAAVKGGSLAIQYASPEMQNDEDIKAIEKRSWIHRLEYFVPTSRLNRSRLKSFDPPRRLKQNRPWQGYINEGNPWDLQHAPLFIRNDKEIVMAAVQEIGMVLAYASPFLRNDKQLVIAAVQSSRGCALQFASPELQSDKQITMEAIVLDGNSLQFASIDIRSNKAVVMTAIQNSRGMALQFATPEMRNDKEVVLRAIQNDTHGDDVFQYASPGLRNDKGMVMTALKNDPNAFHHASSLLQTDKDVVLLYVRSNPDNIKYLNEALKRDSDVMIVAGFFDKDIALPYVRSNPDNIKYLNEALKRDSNVMIAAGLFDDLVKKSGYRTIVLSTRFALHASCNSEATNFANLLKQHLYIKTVGFKIYSPNAFDKNTCDPDWTSIDHPCRGTKDTCQYNNTLTKSGRPTDDCCWRYSFRFQMQEAKDNGGFMIQLVETAGGTVQKLGKGQQIEREMGHQLKLKIFQVYRPRLSYDQGRDLSSDGTEYQFQDRHINEVVRNIQVWYSNGQQDMSECVISFHEGALLSGHEVSRIHT